MEEKDVKISDHKVLEIRLDTKIRLDKKIGKLKGTPDWRKPEQVKTEEWRQILNEIWGEVEEGSPRTAGEKTLGDKEIQVEKSWTRFNKALGELFRRSFTRLETEAKGEENNNLQKKVQAAGRSKRRQRRSRKALLDNPKSPWAERQ